MIQTIQAISIKSAPDCARCPTSNCGSSCVPPARWRTPKRVLGAKSGIPDSARRGKGGMAQAASSSLSDSLKKAPARPTPCRRQIVLHDRA
jgi:hypothetical protein